MPQEEKKPVLISEEPGLKMPLLKLLNVLYPKLKIVDKLSKDVKNVLLTINNVRPVLMD